MENNELVLQAKNGSEDAFESLCVSYAPLLHSMAIKYSSMCKKEAEVKDDFLQEAKIALYKAVTSYNFDSGVTFGAYARTVVKNKLISLVRRVKSKKRNKADTPVTCVEATPQDRAVWKERGEKIYSMADKILSPYEKRVFSMLAKGHRAKEISLHVGKSEKSVNNAIFRIRSKLDGNY